MRVLILTVVLLNFTDDLGNVSKSAKLHSARDGFPEQIGSLFGLALTVSPKLTEWSVPGWPAQASRRA